MGLSAMRYTRSTMLAPGSAPKDSVKLSKAVATNLPNLLKTLGKGMAEATTQFLFKKNFILGLKQLGSRLVEEYLERIKQVLYKKN